MEQNFTVGKDGLFFFLFRFGKRFISVTPRPGHQTEEQTGGEAGLEW